MESIHAQVQQFAPSPSSILITGETGAGKDWLAARIHEQSKRANGPFKIVNCNAIPSELVESELFGYAPGAHSLAKRVKLGLIEVADGGTLVLSEIGDLPLGQQAKLNTFLDTKTFNRLGSEHEVTVDVRIIATTNKNLSEEIQMKRLRSLPREKQRFHIKKLFEEVCGCETGSVSYIAEVLGTTDETIRTELNAAKAFVNPSRMGLTIAWLSFQCRCQPQGFRQC